MLDYVFYFLRLVCFAHQHNVAGINNDHVIYADGDNQTPAAAVVDERIMRLVCEVQAVACRDIAVHVG